MRGIKKNYNKETGSRKMTIDIEFTFLNFVDGREARNRKGVPRVISARNETIRTYALMAQS